MHTFVLKRNIGVWDSETDRLLGDGLALSEWSALFEDGLKCPAVEPYIGGEDRMAWERRQEERFRTSCGNSPMLARIWDPYVDVYYSDVEVISLRAECLALKPSTSNDLAEKALQSLLSACEHAIHEHVGLYLASD